MVRCTAKHARSVLSNARIRAAHALNGDILASPLGSHHESTLRVRLHSSAQRASYPPRAASRVTTSTAPTSGATAQRTCRNRVRVSAVSLPSAWRGARCRTCAPCRGLTATSTTTPWSSARRMTRHVATYLVNLAFGALLSSSRSCYRCFSGMSV